MPQWLEPEDSSGIGLPSDFLYFCCWKWCILVGNPCVGFAGCHCWQHKLFYLHIRWGTQTATGIDFPRVFEWPNAWLLMTFDGKWTCQARIYYDMLWSSSLWASASRFWRQVMSAGAVLLPSGWFFRSEIMISSPLGTDWQKKITTVVLESICWCKNPRLKKPTCQIRMSPFLPGDLEDARPRALSGGRVQRLVKPGEDVRLDRSWFSTFQISVLNCSFVGYGFKKQRNVNFHTLSDMIIVFNVCSGISQVSNFFVCMASLKTSTSLKQSQSISAGT